MISISTIFVFNFNIGNNRGNNAIEGVTLGNQFRFNGFSTSHTVKRARNLWIWHTKLLCNTEKNRCVFSKSFFLCYKRDVFVIQFRDIAEKLNFKIVKWLRNVVIINLWNIGLKLNVKRFIIYQISWCLQMAVHEPLM